MAAKTRAGAKPTRKTTKAVDVQALGSVTDQIAALGSMTVGELQARWREVFEEEPRSRNKDYLRKRIAFRIQEKAEGGLSDRAKARIDELAADAPIRHRAPRQKKQASESADGPASDAAAAQTTSGEGGGAAPAKERDPRLPPAGTILRPKYKRETFEIEVLEEGFRFRGEHYKSLSAVAKAATGQSYNGFLWCGLTDRKPIKKGGDE